MVLAMNLPKPQGYPAGKIAVGTVLYACSAWTDGGKTTTEIREWVVRSIRAKRGSKSRMGHPVSSFGLVNQYVNIAEKLERVTWGKRSSKTGDFGWRTTIPAYYRKQFPVGANLPHGIYTTIRAAVQFELQCTHEMLKVCKAAAAEDREDGEEAELEAQMTALERRLAKLEQAADTKDDE